MTIIYTPKGTCSQKMTIEIENGVVRTLEVIGGCDGNLKGISSLVTGMEVNEVVKRLDGIRCGSKSTSCPDQLVQALKQAL